MKKLYVIDGNSLLFRAYYATSFTGNIMRTKNGIPTNAIFAFSNMISKIVTYLKPEDALFVAFDTGKKTFRHAQLTSYKEQRKPIEEDLKVQLPIAREFLDAMNVFHFELEGYEGDDVAGTVAKLGVESGYDVNIYTSDKDFLQLIQDGITVNLLRKGLSDIEEMNEKSLKEKFGLTPDQIPDYKGLMGDSSDNLKGIPGVGEKTALKLIQEHGHLENIIVAMANEKSKLAQKIIEHQDEGLLCKTLATIQHDVPLPFTLESLTYTGYDFNTLSNFYNKYECYSLLRKLKPSQNNLHAEKQEKSTPENFDQIYIKRFKDIPYQVSTVILDREKGNYNTSLLNGFVLSDGVATYYFAYQDAIKDIQFINFLKNPNEKKSVFDGKALRVALSRDNIQVEGIDFDLLLASYLLDSSLDNDPVTVFSYFGINILHNTSISLFEEDQQFINMAYYLSKIKETTLDKLKEIECLDLYYSIELPLATVLSEMEIEGFPMNREKLEEINSVFQAQLDQITQEIYLLAGYEFNISSPKQIANLLFEHLHLPSNKKESTSVEVLKYLEHLHPIVPLILKHRKYAKLISTYSSGLASYLHQDNKLHAIFNQALTTTGRLSSSEPNLQNITIRDEESKSIRKAFFYPEEDILLLSLDYSQIELRVLASLSNCHDLIDLFNRGEDIHSETASAIFGVNQDEVTPIMRRKAKTVNFGVVYGISDWGLSEQLDIPAKEAKEIIEKFYLRFPEIKNYFDQVIEFAKENGYVKTILNRRRYIPEMQSDNYQTREFGKRAAKNAPIQGSAADLIKIAMIKVSQELKSRNLKSKIVLQIHDELVLKVYADEKDIVMKLAKDIMEHSLNIKTVLEVDGSIGKTWFDAK